MRWVTCWLRAPSPSRAEYRNARGSWNEHGQQLRDGDGHRRPSHPDHAERRRPAECGDRLPQPSRRPQLHPAMRGELPLLVLARSDWLVSVRVSGSVPAIDEGASGGQTPPSFVLRHEAPSNGQLDRIERRDADHRIFRRTCPRRKSITIRGRLAPTGRSPQRAPPGPIAARRLPRTLGRLPRAPAR